LWETEWTVIIELLAESGSHLGKKVPKDPLLLWFKLPEDRNN
jgi:hypothetical protein